MIKNYVTDEYGLNHREINISINLVSAYISKASPSFRGLYHDYKKQLTIQNDFIDLVHCVRGVGKILTTEKEFILSENKAIFVHYHSCVCFSAENSEWEFFTIWFRANNLKIELNKVYEIPVWNEERDMLKSVIDLLNTNEYLNCCKANTLAQSLILDVLSYIGEEDSSPYAESMKKVVLYISKHINENIQVADLATVCAFSKNHFFTIFKRFFKMTPMAYIMRERLKKAAFLLLNTSTPIVNIAKELSFYSSAHFSSCFKKLYGVTPSEFRHKK